MEFCSDLTFINQAKSQLQQQQQQQQPQQYNNFDYQPYQNNSVDTNVVQVRFDILKQAEQNLQIGDPVFCSSCKCVLNRYAKIMTYKEFQTFKNQMNIKLQKKNEEKLKKENLIQEQLKLPVQNASNNQNKKSNLEQILELPQEQQVSFYNSQPTQKKEEGQEPPQQQKNPEQVQQSQEKVQVQLKTEEVQPKVDIQNQQEAQEVKIEQEIDISKQKLSEKQNIVAEQAQKEEEKKGEEKKEEEKKDQLPQVEYMYINNIDKEDNLGAKENDKVWICNFCGELNKCPLEEEEIPTKDDAIYMLQSLQQQQPKGQSADDKSLIFCIDNSGSMCQTTEIQGKIALKNHVTQEEYDMLKQFIDQGDEEQNYFKYNSKTYVSRKQCVLAAIESQLQEIKKSSPQRKVGLITFNNEINVMGDCSGNHSFTVTGDKLNKYDEILTEVTSKVDQVMQKSVSETTQNLIQAFNKMEEKGQTALGPALLCSLALALKGKPGSAIILCTDGLANLGLGSLEVESEESKAFYAKLSAIAKEKGIQISIITIKGEECKLTTLSQVVDETNGTVTRVDPINIGKEFSNILADEVVGTSVELEIHIHKSLKFRDEIEAKISQDGSIYKRNLGNVTVKTKIAFEFETKNLEEIQKLNMDLDELKFVPYQTIIFYNTIEGNRFMRVISSQKKTVSQIEEAEKLANLKVMQTRLMSTTCTMVQRGDYLQAKQYNQKWQNYHQQNQIWMQQPEQKVQNEELLQQNISTKKAIFNKQRRIQQKLESDKLFLQSQQQVSQQYHEQSFPCQNQFNLQQINQAPSQSFQHYMPQPQQLNINPLCQMSQVQQVPQMNVIQQAQQVNNMEQQDVQLQQYQNKPQRKSSFKLESNPVVQQQISESGQVQQLSQNDEVLKQQIQLKEMQIQQLQNECFSGDEAQQLQDSDADEEEIVKQKQQK